MKSNKQLLIKTGFNDYNLNMNLKWTIFLVLLLFHEFHLKIKLVNSGPGLKQSNPKLKSNKHKVIKSTNTLNSNSERQLRKKKKKPGFPKIPKNFKSAPVFYNDEEILQIHKMMLSLPFGDPRANVAMQRQGTDCDLYAEFEPFYYTPLIRKSMATINLVSNCMERISINLEVSYMDNRLVNWNYHPTKLVLNLFGNTYKLIYRKPKVIDRNDILKSIEYPQATLLLDNNTKMNLELRKMNSIYIPPHIKNSFNPFNLHKLQRLNGFWQCRMVPRRFRDYKGRIKRRRNFIDTMKSKGYTNEEIHRVTRNMAFEVADKRGMDVNVIDELINEHNFLQEQKSKPMARELKSTDKNKPNKKRNKHQKKKRTLQKKTSIEVEEEKQRIEEGRMVMKRLNENFINELVIVCSIR